MTLDEFIEIFEEDNDEYIKFERVENKLNHRPDIHAFLLLDQLVPGEGDMVAAACHDEIYLDTNVEELAAVITREQVIDLIRCGVRYGEDSLCMFA